MESDLLREEVKTEALARCGAADFVWVTIGRVGKVRGAPDRHLRPHSHPLGRPGLEGADKELVEVDNDLTEVVLMAA